jgi:hypothetical protein
MFKRVGEHAVRCSCKRPVVRRQIATRRFSVYNNPNASVASTASPLGGLTTELDRIAPRFEVPASRITILDSPSSFYETLKVGSHQNCMGISTIPKLTSIDIAQNQKCATKNIPLDIIYRQDRTRTSRYLEPGIARQPQPSCLYSYGLLARHTGNSEPFIRFTTCVTGRGAWRPC